MQIHIRFTTSLISLSLGLLFFLINPSIVRAEPIIGFHILHPSELEQINQHLPRHEHHWTYVTIPISLDQLDVQLWQDFFDQAKREQVIPIVRLATRYNSEVDAWEVPDRYTILQFANFFNQLDWPSDKRYIIIFNEPNHAKEWGGNIDPAGYAQILDFSLSWFLTESADYQVLPAGFDAEAPNSDATMESFAYMEAMNQAVPGVFERISYWNAHSYPNPAFSGSAYRSGKNSLDGWKYELAYLEDYFGVKKEVFITETGWDQRAIPRYRLVDYYHHAVAEVWSDQRVKGVTPFLLNGNNGVFDHFSFLQPDGSPTTQLEALQAAREKVLGISIEE